MSKICQITGKKAMVGNNVSHSKRRTKRKFDVNLITKKLYWLACVLSINLVWMQQLRKLLKKVI